MNLKTNQEDGSIVLLAGELKKLLEKVQHQMIFLSKENYLII